MEAIRNELKKGDTRDIANTLRLRYYKNVPHPAHCSGQKQFLWNLNFNRKRKVSMPLKNANMILMFF